MLRRLVAIALVSSVALLGCGEDESGFTAEEFVAEANERGAALVLESQLDSTREDMELHAVEIEGPESGEPAALEEHGHAGGTLTITASDAAAAVEHERCELAASLLCYRAGNVVLFLEDALEPGDQARITDALSAMASE